MVLIRDLAIQGAQMLLVLALAPLFTGFVRKVKARLLRRQGPPLIQPYLDLVRLARKEVVLADSASWLFRVIPYLVFAATWVAASLIPTFRTGLLFSWSADLTAGQRPLLPGTRRARRWHKLRRHRLEPRSDDRLARGTGVAHGRIHAGADRRLDPAFDCRRIHGFTAGGLAGVARSWVARADRGGGRRERPHSHRQPGTHLELTMVHEAMVLEYSGRHLALIELSSSLKLLFYVSLLACLFAPWGIENADAAVPALAIGIGAYVGKLAVGGFLLGLFETSIAKMRVFRVPEFLGAALMLGLLATLLRFVSGSF
jgi:formate hydrogenlyase subunit 4